MSQQNFAQFLGISSASLSSIFTGRTKPTLNHVDAIRKKFPEINLDWLMFGSGNMFLDSTSDQISKVNSSASAEEPLINFETINNNSTLHNNSTPNLFDQMQGVGGTLKNKTVKEAKIIDKQPRKVSQIQIIYDDDTIEVFVPKK